MLKNGTVWNDVDGASIQVHGGGLLELEGTWYWYGEDKSGPTRVVVNSRGERVRRVDALGVAGYRSRDLVSWEPMGVVLGPSDEKHHDLSRTGVLERPKVVYHRASGTFVMWLHVDREDYSLAATGVAVSDRPEGPFVYLGTVRPGGRDSRDQTVFVDDDGVAYHFASTEDNATTLVTRMSDDYRSLTGESRLLFPGRYMEAHAIAKTKGRYWYIASGCTGWAPNEARSAVADSIWGPWEELGNPCTGGEDPGTTWGAQSTFMTGLEDGRILAMFDRWRPDDLGNSEYVWVTAEPGEGRFELVWSEQWAGM